MGRGVFKDGRRARVPAHGLRGAVTEVNGRGCAAAAAVSCWGLGSRRKRSGAWVRRCNCWKSGLELLVECMKWRKGFRFL